MDVTLEQFDEKATRKTSFRRGKSTNGKRSGVNYLTVVSTKDDITDSMAYEHSSSSTAAVTASSGTAPFVEFSRVYLAPEEPASEACEQGHKSNMNSIDRGSPTSVVDQLPLVEVEPGHFIRLRGHKETLGYIRAGRPIATQECCACQGTLHCVGDADLVLCPYCRVVQPLT